MKKIWQLLQEGKWKWAAAGGICVLAVTVFALPRVGTGVGSDVGVSEEEATLETERIQDETETEEPEVPVSEMETFLLSELYHAMAERDYDKAAAILNENEEAFRELTGETLEGNLYYYQEVPVETEVLREEEGTLSEETESAETLPEESSMEAELTVKMGQLSKTEFVGMVLTRYNTVFYGEFSEGKPNGEAAAIQTIILDQPRYSYAEGVWHEGKLNGEGTAGYYYYRDIPETGFVRVEKRGRFRDNLLDSDFVYKTESANGEQLSWNMKAVAGVTVITQEWEYYPYRKEYMLASAEDPGRAYVLAKSKVTEVLWNNLIVWPE